MSGLDDIVQKLYNQRKFKQEHNNDKIMSER